MSVIQILLVCFSLTMVVRVVARFRKGGLNVAELTVWIALWTGIAVCVRFPGITSAAAGVLGVGRGADAVFYLSMVAFTYSLYRMYLRMRSLERDITGLTRRLALTEARESSTRQP